MIYLLLIQLCICYLDYNQVNKVLRNNLAFSVPLFISGVARPKLMVGPDYRDTKEVLEDLALAAPG